MVSDLFEREIYEFIVSNFEGAWNSLAGNSGHRTGGGNFMFASRVMNLLELQQDFAMMIELERVEGH